MSVNYQTSNTANGLAVLFEQIYHSPIELLAVEES